MIDEKKLAELRRVISDDRLPEEVLDSLSALWKENAELKNDRDGWRELSDSWARKCDKLEAVARAAERFISQDRRKATVKEMLDVDGDLAVALAALHAPTEGKEKA